MHGWGLRPNAYRGPIEAMAPPGAGSTPPAFPGSAGPASWTPSSVPSPVTPAGSGSSSTPWRSPRWPWWPGTRSAGGVATAFVYDQPGRVSALLLVNAIGSPTWVLLPNEVRTTMQRPVWDWGRHFGTDLLHSPQPGPAAPDPPRGLHPQSRWAIPWACSGPASSSVGPTWSERCGSSPSVGSRCSVAWSDRDRLVSRSAFDELRHAAGVEGVVIEGAHAWPIADPAAFRELAISALVDSGALTPRSAADGTAPRRPTEPDPRRPPGWAVA